jgi:S1-C subfamily serine protease
MGTDPLTDVAVIKIQANNLPTVSLGDSERLKPGEWAIAIGNPLGLDNTVTTGIISGTGRSSSQVGVPDKRVNFIQTDAAINPGNSGGPLLNASGQVIGMNTAIIQGAQGLGFAIPINTAQRIANELIANGKVEHPYLGIQMVTLTPQLKENINNNPNAGLTVNEDSGVLIAKVEPGSPAAKAGLRAGDIIHKVNGQPVNKAEDIQKAVEGSQVGSNLQIELRREQRDINVAVKPGAFPIEQAQR